ncbi:MAG: ribosome maturation factor RimP [Actinobacteria bacterium]|nr:ribosome maturation factor RimP [Actinomycetota bacterium]
MSATHEKERTLQRAIGQNVESSVPGVEVLAVELSADDRFTVFIDHPEGVDHALCVRVTELLADYRRDYAVDVSSPGLERPLRTPAHFRGAVGRQVALRTSERKKKLRGEVVEAGERAVTVRAGDEALEIPYEAIVRGNLIYTEERE